MPGLSRLVLELGSIVRVARAMPTTSAVIVVSTAVGIAANTVVFSWMSAFVVHPIPGVAGASEFHFVEPRTESGASPGSSWLEYRDLRGRIDGFDDLVAFRMSPFNLGESGRTERVFGQLVSGNFFAGLGLTPAAGRLINEVDVDRPRGDPVVVVSYQFWQEKLGAGADAVGQSIRLNGREVFVIGVAPPRFQGTVLGLRFDLWVPATLSPTLLEGSRELDERGIRGYAVMGRLKSGVTIAAAGQAAEAAMADLAAALPDTNRGIRADVLPFWQAPRGPQRQFVAALVLLQGVMALVLLAVCGNAANLVLARASFRERECAVRLALGASRWSIARLVLFENVGLALSGAALGAVLAVWGTNAMRAVPTIGAFPIQFQTDIDLTALGFTALLGVLCGVLFGAAPAFALARVQPARAMRMGEGVIVRTGLRFLLMGSEVAVALVVLIVAGLFLRAFNRAEAADTGFRREGVVLASYDLTGRDTSAVASRTFAARLLERLGETPGIERAAIASSVPLDIHGLPVVSFELEGRPRTDGGVDTALSNTVTPGYFEALDIPMRAGADFAGLDDPSAPAQAIVNDAFVARFLDDRDPLGRFVESRGRRFVIAAVVGTSRYEAFDEPPMPIIYFSYRDRPAARGDVHVRLRSGSQVRSGAEVARVVAELDPVLAVFDVRTMDQHIERNLFLRRIPARMFAVLGPVLLAIAAVGVYAVVGCIVTRRTREIGLRLALGATGGRVVAGLVGENLAVVGLGVLAGLLVSTVAAIRFLPDGSVDLVVFGGVTAVLFAVAAVACWVPARRAAALSPLVVLKAE